MSPSQTAGTPLTAAQTPLPSSLPHPPAWTTTTTAIRAGALDFSAAAAASELENETRHSTLQRQIEKDELHDEKLAEQRRENEQLETMLAAIHTRVALKTPKDTPPVTSTGLTAQHQALRMNKRALDQQDHNDRERDHHHLSTQAPADKRKSQDVPPPLYAEQLAFSRQ